MNGRSPVRDLIFIYAGSPDNQSQSSPYTITRNLYQALSKEYRVHYHDWCHTGDLTKLHKDTIILAHPNYPGNTPAWRLFDQADIIGNPNKFLIFPLHTKMSEINLPFDPLVRRAKHIFSICGSFWYDTLPQTPFAHWQPKITRLDMAVDTHHYPRVKHRFNPPGQRTFTYLGCDRPEKGLGYLAELFKRVPHTLHVYGNVDHPLLHLPNVKNHGYVELTPQFGRDWCHTCDIFLNTSRSDANPTSITEAGSYGLPVACSQTSGYWADQPFYGLNLKDLDGCAHLLHYLQQVPEETLKNQADKQLAWIKNACTWTTFCNRVLTGLQEHATH